jgi:uncharacterized protein (UPF0128 family)
VFFNKFKLRTFEELAGAFNAQAEAEKQWNLNIKSRKFVDLPEKGFDLKIGTVVVFFSSMNDRWLEVKDKIFAIEDIQKQVESKYREFARITLQEMEEYMLMWKQIETDYNSVKKKKSNAIDDLKRVIHICVFCNFFL